MNRSLAAAAVLAAALSPLAHAASADAPQVTLYTDATALARDCDAALAGVRKTVEAMAAVPAIPAKVPPRKKGERRERAEPLPDVFAEWNRLFIQVEDGSNIPALYATVHPDKEVRAAAESCEQKFTSLNTEINQNEKLFARVKAAPTANPRQAKLKRDLLRDFEDSGVALPPDKRARAKAILEKIEEHRQAFERNVREDSAKVTFTPAEMEGLPQAYLDARQKDAAGNYVLGLDPPSYGPFMQNARSEAARERYYRARFRRGGERNLAELEELFRLRQELASLYGLPTYADYALRRKMAANPANVNRFLAEVKAAVAPLEKREMEELRAEKARDLGTPLEATRLAWWDVSYYGERIRRARYDVDQEKLRAYFPADKSVEFTLLLVERLYGIKFRAAEAPTWHPDVRYFEMFDAKSGQYLANAYLDLFPREGKRSGAFAAPIRTASRLTGRTPSAALVANLDRRGFNQRELEVLLHEFGHVLNMLLSNVEYAPQVLSMVKWDFVEAPSQMFEEWARREQTLALFKQVCAACPQLTRDQVSRLEQARRYGMASIYARQQLLAEYDMELSQRPRAPLEAWKALESATPLGYVEGTMFPTSFTHIASGYAAGYYGYMWSRVIARDLLSQFGDDLLNPKIGARYRAAILGAGTEHEESDMVRRFLGREPSSRAFFDEITGRS
jgi:thimet oligopeptidase